MNDYNFQDKVQVKQKIEPAKSSQLTTENAKSTNSNYSICDYAPTKKTSTTINNISAGSVINSDRWRVGLIEHWNEVTIKSLYKVEGVYSTFQFFARQVLESGNGELSYRQNLNYQTTSGFSFYFDRTDASRIEGTMYSNFGYNGDYSNLDTSFSAIASTDMSYTTSAYYTSKIKNNSAYSYSLSLDKNTAYYCPDDYSITIGLCGTFYIGTFDIVEKKSWWGGVQDADFWSYDNTFILVKESTLSYNYVVKQAICC